jgi:hypothetical protein
MTTTTRRIAGHAFTLTPGRTYMASRPMARRGMTRFDVSITDVTHGFDINAKPVAVVPGLDYDAANDLLAAFNDAECYAMGRGW